MSEDLRTRLDRFVVSLLEEAEACEKPSVSDTEEPSSEDGPGPAVQRVSLTERVAVLKAATAWWNARAGKRHEEPEEPEEPPEVDGLIVQLKQRESRQRSRRR